MHTIHLLSKYTICYSVFFLISFITKTENSNRLLSSKGFAINPGMLLGLQLVGILWLGIVPYFILHYSLHDILIGNKTPTIIQLGSVVLLLIAAVTFANLEADRSNAALVKSNQFVAAFRKTFTRRYFVYRIMFLICYETFFRGCLLTDSIHETGIWAAILINTFLYALLHIFNDKKEIIACVPFGILLCCICCWFGAAWPAIVLHTVFAITYELKLVKKNVHTINKIQNENICYRFFGLHRQ
jgi:membrane protease YdiL (CAAX protease family)